MSHPVLSLSILAALALAGCQTLEGSSAEMEGPVAVSAARCAGFFSVISKDIRSAELYEVAKFRAARDGVSLPSLVPAFNDGSAVAQTRSGEAYDALSAGCASLYEDRYEIVNADAAAG